MNPLPPQENLNVSEAPPVAGRSRISLSEVIVHVASYRLYG